MGMLNCQFREGPSTTRNTPPRCPSALICSKCVHSSPSWREIWKRPVSLFSQLTGSPAHMVPEVEGPSETSPNPGEGKCFSQGHTESQQCTEDSNPGLYTLLDGGWPFLDSSWTFLGLSLFDSKIRSSPSLFPQRVLVRIRWDSCDWFMWMVNTFFNPKTLNMGLADGCS